MLQNLCLRLPLLLLLAMLALAPARLYAGEFAVQFTVPSDKDEVWKFVEMLSDLNYPSYMFTQDRGAGMVHYYAQMGTYGSFDAAEQAARELQKDVRVDYEIVHANSNKAVSRAELDDRNQPQSTPPPPVPEPVAKKAPAKAPQPAPEKPAKPEPKAPKPAVQAAQVPEPVVSEPVQEPELEPEPVVSPAPEPENGTKALPGETARPTVPPPPAPEASSPDNDMPPSSGTATAGGTIFLVQLHSFSIKQNALDAARDYERKGYSPVIILLYDDTHTPWYVLSLGHYADRKTASKAAKTFQSRENRSATLNQVDATFLKTRVVPYN